MVSKFFVLFAAFASAVIASTITPSKLEDLEAFENDAALTFAPGIKDVKVYDDMTDFISDHQDLSAADQIEDLIFAVNKSSTGTVQATEVGVSLTRGFSSEMKFRFNVKAVSAQSLAESDSEFVKTLNAEERDFYERTKTSYGGGLRIPFLRVIGFRLGGSVSRERIDRLSTRISNYTEKAKAAEKILQDTQAVDLVVSGKINGFGLSFIPTTGFAFVRFARVTLTSGESFTVISSDPGDVVAATGNGRVLPSTGGEITVTTLDDLNNEGEDEDEDEDDTFAGLP